MDLDMVYRVFEADSQTQIDYSGHPDVVQDEERS